MCARNGDLTPSFLFVRLLASTVNLAASPEVYSPTCFILSFPRMTYSPKSHAPSFSSTPSCAARSSLHLRHVATDTWNVEDSVLSLRERRTHDLEDCQRSRSCLPTVGIREDDANDMHDL